jgi:spermidine/putrescine transport system permease protein
MTSRLPSAVRHLPAIVFTAAVMRFLFLPTALMALFSFNGSASITFPITDLSLRWYRLVFTDEVFTDAMRASATVALVTALSTLVLGTMAVLGLVRAGPRQRGALSALFFAPITLPALFVGLGLAIFLGEVKLPGLYPFSINTVFIAHFLFTFPYFLLIAQAALERLDPQLDEVAADLGARPFQQFSRVTLPIAAPMIGAATLFAVALSFDEFVRTFFVIGADSTVPMVLWSRLRTNVDPAINALATLLLLVTIVGVLVAVIVVFTRTTVRRGQTRA